MRRLLLVPFVSAILALSIVHANAQELTPDQVRAHPETPLSSVSSNGPVAASPAPMSLRAKTAAISDVFGTQLYTGANSL